jgi:hypothetical protein
LQHFFFHWCNGQKWSVYIVGKLGYTTWICCLCNQRVAVLISLVLMHWQQHKWCKKI